MSLLTQQHNVENNLEVGTGDERLSTGERANPNFSEDLGSFRDYKQVKADAEQIASVNGLEKVPQTVGELLARNGATQAGKIAIGKGAAAAAGGVLLRAVGGGIITFTVSEIVEKRPVASATLADHQLHEIERLGDGKTQTDTQKQLSDTLSKVSQEYPDNQFSVQQFEDEKGKQHLILVSDNTVIPIMRNESVIGYPPSKEDMPPGFEEYLERNRIREEENGTELIPSPGTKEEEDFFPDPNSPSPPLEKKEEGPDLVPPLERPDQDDSVEDPHDPTQAQNIGIQASAGSQKEPEARSESDQRKEPAEMSDGELNEEYDALDDEFEKIDSSIEQMKQDVIKLTAQGSYVEAGNKSAEIEELEAKGDAVLESQLALQEEIEARQAAGSYNPVPGKITEITTLKKGESLSNEQVEELQSWLNNEAASGNVEAVTKVLSQLSESNNPEVQQQGADWLDNNNDFVKVHREEVLSSLGYLSPQGNVKQEALKKQFANPQSMLSASKISQNTIATLYDDRAAPANNEERVQLFKELGFDKLSPDQQKPLFSPSQETIQGILDQVESDVGLPDGIRSENITLNENNELVDGESGKVIGKVTWEERQSKTSYVQAKITIQGETPTGAPSEQTVRWHSKIEKDIAEAPVVRVHQASPPSKNADDKVYLITPEVAETLKEDTVAQKYLITGKNGETYLNEEKLTIDRDAARNAQDRRTARRLNEVWKKGQEGSHLESVPPY